MGYSENLGFKIQTQRVGIFEGLRQFLQNEMKLNSLAERICVMNLKHRTDRLQSFETQAARFGFYYEVWHGLNGQEHFAEYQGPLRKGDMGLLSTYEEIVHRALIEGCQSLLTFEDDAFFVDDFQERLEKEWAEIPEDWDAVYLGGNHFSLGAGYIQPESVSENVMRIFSSYGCQAVLLKRRLFEPALELIQRFDRPLDVAFCDLQQQHNVYSFKKSLVKQFDSHSDIIQMNPRYCEAGIFS